MGMAILHNLGTYILAQPVLAIFFCLGIGYLLGRVRIGSFTVGATVGTLVVGLLVSFVLAPLGVFKVDPLVKSIFFTLFIFTIGYEVGPAFFKSLRSNGLKVVILSVFFAVTAFVICFGLFKLLKIAPGEAAGIVAGSLTQSAVLGTAGSAIRSLMAGTAQKEALAQLPIAYAITYVFGTAGIIIFMKNVAPRLLGVDLKKATQEKIVRTGFKEAVTNDVISAVKARVLCVEKESALIGKSVREIEAHFADRLSLEQMYRDDKIFAFDENTVIEAGDILTWIGDLASVVDVESRGLRELTDEKYRRISPCRREVVLTRSFDPAVLDTLSLHGIIVLHAKKDGAEVTDLGRLQAADEIVLVGPQQAVGKVVRHLGYVKDTGTATDVSFLSIGAIAGLLIGALSLRIHGVPVTLGAGGGALVGGLVWGWYQNRHADHGYIPAATRWFLKSVGLNLFIAVVGLTAGSTFLAALRQMGVIVLLLGVVVTLAPHIVTLLFGRFVLKMDAVDIIGALCGAGTCTSALNGVIDETGSSVFAMGYTPGYAVGNILITVLGPLLVSVLL